MIYDNGHLAELRQQVARRKHLEASLVRLTAQQQDLRRKAAQLETKKLEEQKDVDRLERGSLASFFYNVIGRLDEKLDTERAEAYAARVKYDAASLSLHSVEMDLAKAQAELAELQNCEEAYAHALEEKRAAIKAACLPGEEQIIALEAELAELQNQLTQLEEATAAGNAAYSLSGKVLDALEDADGYAAWDVMGGGLLADIAKHDSLDQAQNQVNLLQQHLNRFHTELADVSVSADIQVSLDDFTSFADFVFDNIFTDWAVMDHIDHALQQTKQTRSEIKATLDMLLKLEAQLRDRYARVRDQLEQTVVETTV